MRIHNIILAGLTALSASFLSTAHAAPFQSGNWAAARIGQTCYVFSLHAARDTSGALVFSFGPGGYNASFAYEYAPWPGENEVPWDADDSVVLEVDGEEIWLGEEMFTGEGTNGYRADMTDGFVPEMIATLLSAQSTVSVNFDRVAHGEIWVYGGFAIDGFSDSLAAAGAQCGFDPNRLSSS